jgi:PAS domain S-box-containing protein
MEEALGGRNASWSDEYRFRRGDSRWAWVSTRGVIERDDQGRAVVVAAMLDVTERAGAQQRLQEMQHLLLEAQRIGQVRAWEENLSSGSVKMDRTAPTRGAEPSYGEYPRAEAFSLVHPDDLPRLMQLRERTIETGAPFDTEFRMLAPDGSERDMLVRGELICDAARQPKRIVGTSLDITERKRAEDALVRSERLLNLVLTTIPVAVLVLNRAGDVVLANRTYKEIWGGLIVSVQDRWTRSAGKWRDSGKPVEIWASQRALQLGQTSLKELVDIESLDGKRKTIENSAAPIRDKDAIVGAVVVNEEVTDRVRFEEELQRRLRQHAAVAQLGQSALRSGDLATLFAEAVELVASSSSFDFAEVTEVMPDQSILLRAAHGWKEGLAAKLRLPAGGTLSALSIADGQPRVAEDLRQEKRFVVAPVILDQGIVSHVIVVIGRASQLRDQRRQLQMLSRRLLAAQEAERRAVARELHDDFGHVLTALKMNLQRRERDDAESIALVDGAIERMRDLAQDLRPPLLDELGLESSLRWYFEREAKRAGLELQLDLEPLPTRSSPEVETTCFQVAQEALTNTIRHAQARRVEVQLRTVDKELVLQMRDDGRGFDVAEARRRAAHGGSQGLISMQERVALASGELRIDSKPGRGTVVLVRLPLAMRNAA